MKYGIAIFPSKKLQDLVNSYRKRYDPQYSLIPPHITLKYSFEASEEEMKDITKQLWETAAKTAPIQLNVVKASTFQPVSNVIYLKVDVNNELETLHKQMHNVIKSEDEFAFVPHLTLAQGLSNDEHSDVFGQLSMIDFSHSENIDRFHLLYQLENGSWTVYETFQLGRE
ncbi:YjcG family protein [Bacillus massiliigorillae]|uniref:YjcG family protein n=1 Tax=Bacillus massiliigorillae TaxID=1243664 RepID=UPI0003A3CA19|nr:YjcG family protein [Bacillus massiliigorillae]